MSESRQYINIMFALFLLDSPVFISHPHFYNGDPALLQTVNGLSPSEHDHGLFIDIHPVRKSVHIYKIYSGKLRVRVRFSSKLRGMNQCISNYVHCES